MVPEKRAKANSPEKISPSPVRQQSHAAVRLWYHDAIISLACFALCLTLGKGVSRLFGLFGGLFFFLITAGAGYIYGKSAWRGLMGDRNRR